MAKHEVKWAKKKNLCDVFGEVETTCDSLPLSPWFSGWESPKKSTVLKDYAKYLKAVRAYVASLPEVEDIKDLPVFDGEE